ncbi:DNA recombination protein RmuC [uncultured Ilumatobacter sp.]|jgi:DNA recombination protein RmuC|uniref:DNA recombination protein RmuC n=1 Tax=uncultured Ilumatobacter sp. TaxID=879968 RepID=UPI00374E88C5
MFIVIIVLSLVLAGCAVAAAYFFAFRQATTVEALQASIDSAVQGAVAAVRQQATEERDAAVSAAVAHTAILNGEQFGAAAKLASADLAAKKDIIDTRLDQVHGEMRNELSKLTDLVNALGKTSAEKFGAVETSLKAHAEGAAAVAESAQALRTAIANPQARGQWGERMAEDVLRMAGFVENTNYFKQTQIDGATGRPDYTFPMPKDHALYMDVKFPMASYLRYLEADTDAERETHTKKFLSDVRMRVKELAKRDYGNTGNQQAVDSVLLFIPNEQLTSFIHEHDPGLLDDAMKQQIVMCSPLTLFAFLGVIRQAFDNFMIEKTSDQILQLIGKFGTQWTNYSDQVDKVKKRFEAVDKEFEALAGTRRRALERPLRELDGIRQQRGLPVDGELFAGDEDEDENETHVGGTVGQLGASPTLAPD